MRASLVFAILLSVQFFTPTAHATTWHILPDGTGDAPTIQAGIDSASAGDTVLVASGTYQEPMINTGTYGNSMIVMKSGVCLVGESEPEFVVLDAQGSGRVIYCQGVTSATTISSLRITGGDADGFRQIGAGILCFSGSSPLIEDCIIDQNEGHSGGGVASYSNSSPTIRACTLADNSVPNGNGGGIICYQGGSTLIEDNIFRQNSATYGGAIFVYVSSSAVITGNTIEDNWGGASSALQANLSTVTFENNLIINNTAEGATCEVVESANVTMTGNTFWGNSGVRVVLVKGAPNPSLQFHNNIVAENTGYGLQYLSGSLTMSCNNFWQNSDGNYSGTGASTNDFSADPFFCDASTGDFTLHANSPCAPGNHPDGAACGLIGALDVGCGATTAVEHTSWGAVKGMWR